jgi:Ca2+-binding RTX toxin-like protein
LKCIKVDLLPGEEVRITYTTSFVRPSPTKDFTNVAKAVARNAFSDTASVGMHVSGRECTERGTPRASAASDGDDTITGTSHQDVICGFGGNDTIHGRGGDDTIYGGSGKDLVDGGTGTDTCFGQQGTDTRKSCEKGSG